MPPTLADDSYGKSAIRLVKVVRDGARHTVHDLTVDVRCEGEFRAAHVDGDNTAVLPTDTMKNIVYALARQHDVHPPERFAALVGERVLAESPQATRVVVEIARHGWNRIDVHGGKHDTAFEFGGAEVRIASVGSVRGKAAANEAGLRDLIVLRTAGSAFSGFPRDAYTTLKETRDRILSTSVTARWRYGSMPTNPDSAFDAVRRALLETFAGHRSESVQHTLCAMGEAAIGASDDVQEIRLSLPNRHHLLADLAPFGLDNPNEIFVPVAEPYGLIEATVRR
jgi:urate oxidase